MKESLSLATDEMMSKLTLSANITASAPIQGSLKGFEFILVFMDTILATIVAFLAILCV